MQPRVRADAVRLHARRDRRVAGVAPGALGAGARESDRKPRAFGATPEWFTELVPTKHQRIPVTRDATLDRALADASRILGPAPHAASRVHQLAVLGAAALVAEDRDRRAALERLAHRSTDPDGPFDRDVLARLGRDAWGFDDPR
jgi:hypothetical protein